jgi:NlpC/P60 family putative phage cell wall peptidase
VTVTVTVTVINPVTEAVLRDYIVEEAESWLGTPFHHMARVKGAGVDCLMLLCEVYEKVGIVPHIPTEYYPPDWHMHRDVERYMDGLRRYAEEVEVPLRGDIAMVKMGRVFSHGAIITEYPYIIHAYWGAHCVTRGSVLNVPFSGRTVKFFSPFRRPPSYE